MSLEPVPTAKASCPLSERDPCYLFFVLVGIFGIFCLSLSPSLQPAFPVLERGGVEEMVPLASSQEDGPPFCLRLSPESGWVLPVSFPFLGFSTPWQSGGQKSGLAEQGPIPPSLPVMLTIMQHAT